MVTPPLTESEKLTAKRAGMNRVRTKLKGGKRRNKIKHILGTKFVEIRQLGDELEIITNEDIPEGQMTRIRRIWEREE